MARRLKSRATVTAPRIVVRGATMALTRRTTFRKAFLADWAPEVDGVWLYALADAAREHRVAVHHAVRVVTHHHLTVTLTEPNLGAFLRRFHRELSCGLNVLLAAYGFDAPMSVFDARPTHAMRLLNWEAEAEHLVYERLNPVAAGLVDTAREMPGRGLGLERWGRGALVVKRPDVYFGTDRPQELRLELTPPPALLRAGDGDVVRLRKALLEEADRGEAQLRRERIRPALGPDALRSMHPWQEPKTLAEPGGGRVPRFKVGGRGPAARALRIRASLEWKHWKGGYWGSLDHRPAHRATPFPYGTYEMRRCHRGNVADPAPDALLAAPGDVEGVEPAGRDALRDAAQTGAEDTIEAMKTAEEHDAVNAERGEPEERQRFTKRKPRKDAPRLVVKRDRRRGRPSPWAPSPPDEPPEPAC